MTARACARCESSYVTGAGRQSPLCEECRPSYGFCGKCSTVKSNDAFTGGNPVKSGGCRDCKRSAYLARRGGNLRQCGHCDSSFTVQATGSRTLCEQCRDEVKRCASCNTYLPCANFYVRGGSDGSRLTARCKSCRVDEWASRPVVMRYRVAERRHNMNPGDYLRILTRQGGTCAICNRTPDEANPTGKILSVDHDHTCCPGVVSCGKCVRGLLCTDCNFAIGLFNDSSHRFDAALSYLKGA